MKYVLTYFTMFFVFTISLSSTLGLANSYSNGENENAKTVYFTTDGSSVYIVQPNLFVQIRMLQAQGHSGAEIVKISYKGCDNIVNSDPQFGQLTLFNPETRTTMIANIGSTNLVFESGNDTGKLTLVFASSEVCPINGQMIAVSTLIKYVFYADIDDIFINVEFNSEQKSWLFASSTYGASLNFVPFQIYNITGYEYHNYVCGSLDKKGQILYENEPRYNILTLKNISHDIAVTLFPTSIFLNLGTIVDYPGSSKISLAHSRVRTWDGNWVEYGSYFADGLTYSCAWAFSSDGNPFVVTPWILPNSRPYGVYWTLDDLPASRGFLVVPPDPRASEMNNLTSWLGRGLGTTRRVTVLWSYDQIAKGIYQRSADGVFQSWAFHGSLRVDNMSVENRNYYASIYGQQVGYGTHSYHHDYPWLWEFSGVTNVSWINATWNQMYLDAQAFLGNTTLNTFKAAGYRLQPESLNVITNYGIQQYEAAASNRHIPLYFGFKDDAGNRLVGTIDVSSASDDVNNGKSSIEVANDLMGNLTTYGLCSIAGHFLNSNDTWATFNDAFGQIESRFGDNLDYFLTKDLNDYWINVLWDNSYTFNTTEIFSTSKDPRLTYMLLNRPPSFNIDYGLGCQVSDSAFHELFSPNFDTKGWKFTGITGYAAISGTFDSGNSLSFVATKPLNTVTSVKIRVPQDKFVDVVGVDSYSYDSEACVLSLNFEKNEVTSDVRIDYQGATQSSTLSPSSSTPASYSPPSKASKEKLPTSPPEPSANSTGSPLSSVTTPNPLPWTDLTSYAVGICVMVFAIPFVQLALLKRRARKAKL